MLTDNLSMPTGDIRDIIREAFKAGFRAGDASRDGAMGSAMRDLEKAVRADKIGSIAVTGKRDHNGKWLHGSYLTVESALEKIDKLRDAANKPQGC